MSDLKSLGLDISKASIRNLCCFDDFYSIFFLSGSPTTFKRGVDFDTYIISVFCYVFCTPVHCDFIDISNVASSNMHILEQFLK